MPSSYPTTYAVEVAFGSAPLALSPTWTTLSAKHVIGLSIKVGKQEALDEVQPGVLTLTLENSARTYDPLNTAGTYYGNLVPGVRIRVKATCAGVTYEIFNGFVDGWPVRYRPGLVAYMTVTATDAMKYLRRRISTNPYSETVAADGAQQRFHLNETGGTRLYEASGLTAPWDGTWGADRKNYTSESLVVGGDSALKLAALPDPTTGRIGTIFDVTPCSLEFWFKADKPPDADYGDWASLIWQGGLGLQIASSSYNYGYGAGSIRFVISDGTNGLIADTNWGYFNYSVCDGRPHHVVCTYNAVQTQAHIWVDGIDRLMTQSITPITAFLFFIGGFTLNAYGSWDGEAVLDELALYSSIELSQSQVQAHYAAGSNPWAGDVTGTRVGRMLDLMDWPATWRDIDTGQQVLGMAEWGADATWTEYLDLVANTEQGRWGVAWWDSGKVYFRDRGSVFTDSRSTVVQAVFTDDSAATGTAVRYESVDLSYDEAQLLREVTVKWQDGEVTVADSTLTTTDLYRSATVETLLATAEEARNLGEYLIGRYGAPFVRVKSITVQPNKLANGTVAWQDNAWAACLGLREGDRVTVRMQPQGVGFAFTLTCLVEGKEHDGGNGVEDWATTFYLSPIDATTTAWLLGTGALDSTTVLSF